MTVIVTNAKNRIAYNIVRSLGQKGIPVITSDFVPLSMSFSSRFSRGHFLYPSPFSPDNERFVDCIIDNIIGSNAEVLIPVSEETFLVAKFKERLSRHAGLAVPDYDQILVAHNKDRWEKIARELNLAVPETFDPIEIRNFPALADELPYPIIVKPKQGGGGWGIAMIGTAGELVQFLNKDHYCGHTWDRFYLQRKIAGETHCVAMLFSKGDIRAKVAYKQLRAYPLKNGQATLRVSLDSPHAEKNLQTLLEHMNWHGVCQADFVVEAATGTPYLIDINPRFWGSLAQGIAAGVDFPYLYYKIALEGDVAPVKGFKTGVMTRWIGGDIRAFFPLFKEADHKIAFAKEFFLPHAGKIYMDDFSLDDPLPFITWCADAFTRVIRNRTLKSVPHDSLEGIWE
jgi:predicted ATP-grasp superfamily ATP-dependent carboligase